MTIIGIWFIEALVGVILGLLGVVIARKTKRNLRGNGVRVIVANGDITQEALRLLIELLFLYAAIIAVINPTRVDDAIDLGDTIVWALIIAGAILPLKSYLSWKNRRDALRYLDAHTVDTPGGGYYVAGELGPEDLLNPKERIGADYD